MAEYAINKGIGRPAEFKGLKAQYLFIFAGGLLAVFLLFIILYMAGGEPVGVHRPGRGALPVAGMAYLPTERELRPPTMRPCTGRGLKLSGCCRIIQWS